MPSSSPAQPQTSQKGSFTFPTPGSRLSRSSSSDLDQWRKSFRQPAVCLVLAGIGIICILLLWTGGGLGQYRNDAVMYRQPEETSVTTKENANSRFKNLIMVTGHSVYKTHNFTDPTDNDNWLLLSYQQKPGQAASFVEHIKMGVEAAAADTRAVLLFSGGYTRADAGQMSEAGSYWQVADALDWFGRDEVKLKTVLEDRARDSFENLLFSICRFKQFTGNYPSKFTIISYDFKRSRFIDLHGKSLGIADDQITFLGTPATDKEGARKGEAATFALFRKDTYGCRGALQEKKADRDPYANGTPDSSTCPALKPFLSGPCMTSAYRGALPWQQQRTPRDKLQPR